MKKEIYNQKIAFGNYILGINKETEIFYNDIYKNANYYISNNERYNQTKAVAKAIYQLAGEGGYFWRSLIGGKFYIQDVIKKGPNCIDYSVIVKDLLKNKFNINGKIKETKLVLVNNHQYFLTDRGEVIDLIVGVPEFPEGYYKSEELYLNELNKINSLGFKIVLQQIKAIIFPGKRKKLC